MSLGRLTSLSTQTLSLLLERQRFQTLPTSQGSTGTNTLHLPQIEKNLSSLRIGILELEGKDGRSEAVQLLRDQYDRMKGMLDGILSVPSLQTEQIVDLQDAKSPQHEDDSSLRSLSPQSRSRQLRGEHEVRYAPYTDDPEAGYDTGILLQSQQQLIDEQDEHLDRLSHSIQRQHHISLQINDELDVHTGLLEQLDTDLDNTENRLTSARRKLDKFAKGAKENASTVTIAVLIVVLLILVIVNKT
ncbi:hypothetical protein AX16_000815 [Volvariella volvacea WC 439]|nr:hypothetical protein AX16_000815 [Volvariella volvacea WC 439]